MTEAGVPAERTALAWRRTALAAMGNAVLMMKVAVLGGWGTGSTTVIGLCGVAAMLVVTVAALVRNRSLHQGHRGHAGLLVGLVTVAIVAVGLSVSVSVLLRFA